MVRLSLKSRKQQNQMEHNHYHAFSLQPSSLKSYNLSSSPLKLRWHRLGLDSYPLPRSDTQSCYQPISEPQETRKCDESYDSFGKSFSPSPLLTFLHNIVVPEPGLDLLILVAVIIVTRFPSPSSPIHLFPQSNNTPTLSFTDSTIDNSSRFWNVQHISLFFPNSRLVLLRLCDSHLPDNVITVLFGIEIVKHLESIIPTRSWTSDSYHLASPHTIFLSVLVTTPDITGLCTMYFDLSKFTFFNQLIHTFLNLTKVFVGVTIKLALKMKVFSTRIDLCSDIGWRSNTIPFIVIFDLI